jgi:uncharacterized metal-binding protein
MKCDECTEKSCRKGEPCITRDSVELYGDGNDAKVMRTAASIEGEFYGSYNRIQEIIVFALRMGFKKVGLAFCTGLSEEAAKLGEILREYFKVESVCCKVCSIPKTEMGVELSELVGPISCNPIEQARVLEEAGTELNLVMGLCVGHDALFLKHSHTYTIPVACKDRVLGHNPLAALYASAPYKSMKKKRLA